MKKTVFLLSIKEWNLDHIHQEYLWRPFKLVGHRLEFLGKPVARIVLSVLFLFGLFINYTEPRLPSFIRDYLPDLFAATGLIMTLKSFAERGRATLAWGFAIAGQMFILLSVTLLNEEFGHNFILIYLSGTIIAAIAGYGLLKKVEKIDGDIELNQFHGYAYEQPLVGVLFLVSCLGLVGLPITPTFIGIDLLFNHIHKHEALLIFVTALSFLFMELSILRIYARIFLGQHKKPDHPMAFRSS